MPDKNGTWVNPLHSDNDKRLPRIAGPSGMVIFGVTGDLARRKLLPAIYDLANRGLLPAGFTLIGFGRREWSKQDFEDYVWQAVAEGARVLRPGGRLLITSLARHGHRTAVEAFGHINLGFTAKELRRFVDRTGLELQSCETVTREKRPPHFEVISLIAGKP